MIKIAILCLCFPFFISCQSSSVSGTNSSREAKQEESDRDFQKQIDKWVSDGKKLNEPQFVDSAHSDYPIIYASGSCLENSINFLLSHGADAKAVSSSSSPGLTALDHIAISVLCSDERAARIAEALLAHGADVNYKQPDGSTALFESFEENHPKLVEVLVQHGADINAQNVNGLTPLQAAAMGGYKSIVEILINHGADINARDSRGNTALAYSQMGKTAPNAQSDGHDMEGTIKLLQNHGAQ